MTNAIEITNLTKSFKHKPVFQELNLTVPEKALTVIYGKSGCGKSTLLNIIGLLEQADAGTINLLGEKAPKAGTRKAQSFIKNNINYLFQNYALLNEQSIKKNLELVHFISRETKADFDERAKKILASLNLEVDLNTNVASLSGGQKQRIALARTLLKPGKLILCDEPTGSLDPENRDYILLALNKAKNAGKTVLVVTHDPYIIKKSDFSYDLKELYKDG
ncbi:ATP-binding cassette domain-containing protein [Lactobacillus mulieris]|uniref:ATP-binding cassette domain-containing protein n=1 Tax=Lactobacillus mulieris TaxID=2508708 RepID=UPI001432B591|nr:ATP-binding cassette domain-containing protein [Lactobacillus mulieris]MCF1784016.1 ATP-binding cassette domain-containing protein [Lactobacillus mulieris]MCW8104875.1 ATP-binding cassette domain-containing protein [Lactobacillus mulieris]MDK6803819.1 ATP-binding cassette domain-containing protein [Lactobacillus mulieris]MDK8382993.1 ATP-binding cassette domain-containing protein [Lactobacillus mulieris]MDT9621122.1 ATP-binding cassette domain-containing protein [Lactobacillus mulieris]